MFPRTNKFLVAFVAALLVFAVSVSFSEAATPERVAPVSPGTHLTRLESFDTRIPAVKAAAGGDAGESYVVSVRSFKAESPADKFKEQLKSDGYNAYSSEAVVKGTKWYRVRVGFYGDRPEAEKILRKIRGDYKSVANKAWVARVDSSDKEAAGGLWRAVDTGPAAGTKLAKGSLPPQSAATTQESKDKKAASPKPAASKRPLVKKAQAKRAPVKRAPVKRAPVKRAAAKAKSSPASPAGASTTAGEKIKINFVNVNIATLVKFISDTTGKNFIYDERLKGKVTIIAPEPLDKADAFDLFTSLLSLKGFATVKTGNTYKILPASMVKQSSMDVLSGSVSRQVNEGYIARVIKLSYLKSSDLHPLIQPLVSQDGYISSFGQNNSLFIVDTSLNLKKILKIVDLMDVKTDDYLPELIFLEHADVDEIITILKEGVGAAAAPIQRGVRPGQSTAASGGELKFISDKRLNAILVFGSDKDVLRTRELIALLDVPSKESSSRINVYYLENADAVDLAGVLNGLLGEGGKSKMQATTPGKAIASSVHSALKPSELSGKIAITPDATTNSLIIMASPESYMAVKRVIKMLDRRPKQVFVEAMILEVSVDDALALGVKWRAGGLFGSDNVSVGGVGKISLESAQSLFAGLAGFSLGAGGNILNIPVTAADGTVSILSTPGYSVLFNMDEFKNVVEVLSTPHILTSDNKEAEIVVGENVPFLSAIERSSSTTNQPLIQSIERKDIGITLRIKPQVSEGGYVKLDIYQEISAFSETLVSGDATDIITTKRSASTSVVVGDRQTVVIGGLIQNQEVDNRSKIPIFGNIPFIGWLFKSRTSTTKKTNLLVYLTPTIIDDFKELGEMKDKREQLFNESSGRSAPEASSHKAEELEEDDTGSTADQDSLADWDPVDE